MTSPTPKSAERSSALNGTADLYLDLLKRALSGLLYEDPAFVALTRSIEPFDRERRLQGLDWPTAAATMIGAARLDSIEECVTEVLQNGIPGDLVETGVWRGGATILMRAVLKVQGDTTRCVWVADSFQGLPQPDGDRYPADAGDALWTFPELAVPLETVRTNFERYGLLDDQVRFLPGWFRDTLPSAPIEQIAVLRLDGDLYESTMLALDSLYAKVSPGGIVIVDDYALPTCRAAVDDFRTEHRIDDELHEIDWTGVYWRKSRT